VLEADDDLVTRVAEELKRPLRINPALDERVMAQVRSEPLRRTHWLLRSRTVRVTPLGALALAAGVAGLVIGTAVTTLKLRPVREAAVAATSGVSFVLYAPDAQSVALVGDFNDWDTAATPLRPSGSSGAWGITMPLPPGRYRYGFVIDGTQWLADPGAPPAPDDGFGTPNSVLTVGT
jgi:hypothetical protein